LSNSLGEAEETKVWLDFARDCGYLSAQDHQRRTIGYDRVSAMRWTLMTRWETFS
jgi:four helix bundle protein